MASHRTPGVDRRIAAMAPSRRTFVAGLSASLLVPQSGRAQTSNTILGDESTGRDATLVNCTVIGRAAGVRAVAESTSLIGDGAGIDGNFRLCDIRGQYAAHFAKLVEVVADGYGVLEFAQVNRGRFSGVYAGHSAFGEHLTGSGHSALTGAIGKHLIAEGDDAGVYAEGEMLTMIGSGVTTARVSGPQVPISEILIGDPTTRWVARSHKLGAPGQRINLFIFGDEMPTTAHGPFVNAEMRPFTVIDADHIEYTGNKYRAISQGRNVRVAINTNKPKRSVAIGAGSIISGDDQVIVNGKDLSDSGISKALRFLK